MHDTPYRNDEGMTTVAYVMATGLSLIVLTWCAMFIIASYTRAAIRGASERATRSAVTSFSTGKSFELSRTSCMEAYNNDIDEALPGTMSESLSATCNIENGKVSVVVTGTFEGLGALLSGSSFTERTSRRLESLP